MYTKSVIDKLTEKLAEELSPEQLEELTRLCEGIYQPVTFGIPPNGFLRHVACGGSYAEECHTSHEFSEQDCSEEGRFDWGDCESTPSGPFAGPEPVHPICSATPPHTYACSADHFSCETETFSCSGSTGNSFTCTQANDETFDCSTNVTCYLEFECEEFDCEAYFGCAENYNCPDNFECKGNAGFTCGEGLSGPDNFTCDESNYGFGCGYADAGGETHGLFTCRDIHSCPAEFTCYRLDLCGTSPDVDLFTCGEATAPTGPSSGSFTCVFSNTCFDNFGCLHMHSCGKSGGASPDSFTCGTAENSGDSFQCMDYFECNDQFACTDLFNCDDYFRCGTDEAEDRFTCGDGGQNDEFHCGDATLPNYFFCNTQDQFDCDPSYGCPDEGFDCKANFICSGAQNQFDCGTPQFQKFTCPVEFNCEHGAGTIFNCPGQFDCYTAFSCGGEIVTSTFTCSGAGGTWFTCGSNDDNKGNDEFSCYHPGRFACSLSYNCPPGEFRGYNCLELYTCDDNPSYYCYEGREFNTCTSQSPYVCNDNSRAVFRCGSGSSSFECDFADAFSCPKTFVCEGMEGDRTYYDCATMFNCGNDSSSTTFRCDYKFTCDIFACGQTSLFDCQDAEDGGAHAFACFDFSCAPGNAHECYRVFRCRDQSGFNCIGTYRCQGQVFICEMEQDGFRCSANGQTPDFQCSNEVGVDFFCAMGQGSAFDCGAVPGFECSVQHIFGCSGFPAGGSFTCSRFACRPRGQCTDGTPYGCTSGHTCAGYYNEQPGDFACNDSHECVLDFTCGSSLPSEGFYCQQANQEFICGQQAAFTCTPPQSHYYDEPLSAQDFTYESGVKLVSSPEISSVPKNSPRLETIGHLLELIRRRSQITSKEASALLENVLAYQFGLRGPFSPETRLSHLGVDVGMLHVKLGFGHLQDSIKSD